MGSGFLSALGGGMQGGGEAAVQAGQASWLDRLKRGQMEDERGYQSQEWTKRFGLESDLERELLDRRIAGSKAVAGITSGEGKKEEDKVAKRNLDGDLNDILANPLIGNKDAAIETRLNTYHSIHGKSAIGPIEYINPDTGEHKRIVWSDE